MSGTPTWPEPPPPGRMVRLPLPLPPMLVEAVGYDGSARYLALWWTPLGDELMWSDGTTTATGGFHAWLCLTGHPIGRAILGRYRLGNSETEAEEVLLADRWQGTLEVGRKRDVRQFLATQPSELESLVSALSDQEREAVLTQALAAAERRARSSDEELMAQVERRLRREAELTRALQRWLDELAERSLGET